MARKKKPVADVLVRSMLLFLAGLYLGWKARAMTITPCPDPTPAGCLEQYPFLGLPGFPFDIRS